MYRLGGTVFRAGTAACFIVVDDAVLDDELYLSHLGVVLLLFGQWKDGAGRAHLPTNGTVVIAEAMIEVEPGLHHSPQSIFQECRLDDMRRALAHAEVTGDTFLPQVIESGDPGRSDGDLSAQILLGHQAVGGALCQQFSGSQSGNQRCGEKTSLGWILWLRFFDVGERRSLLFLVVFPGEYKTVFHGITIAALDAVETGDTPALVDLLILRIDTGSFAFHAAEAAGVALLIIESDLEKGILADKTEEGTHGANGIAPCPAVPPGKDADHQQHGKGDHGGGDAQQIDAHPVERVVVERGEDGSQQVVPSKVCGTEEVGDHPAVSAVGIQEAREEGEAEEKRDKGCTQHTPAKNGLGFAVMILFLPDNPFGEPCHDILVDTHGAEGGAIDSTKEECKDHQSGKDHQVGGQQCRDKLQFGKKLQLIG